MSSLSPDLSDIRWKLGRAKEQLDSLRQDIAPYMNEPPYRLVAEDTEGPPGAGAAKDIRVIIDRPPPRAEWSGRLGEIAHNCRSALDQLVVQLVAASGNVPNPKARTQYPIFLSSKDYREKRHGARQSRRDRMLDGVGSRFRKIIDDSQPYHRSGRIENDPLAILETISNRDKHRNAHPCLIHMHEFTVAFSYPNGQRAEWTIQPLGGPDGRDPLGENTWLCAMAPGDPHAKMEVGDDFRLDFAFQTDTIVVALDDLERIVVKASEIIDRAESEIARGRP